MITETTLQYLLAGSVLGLSSGISPGPLFTLVVTQTIKHDKTEGIKVALSPLITDLPIILIAVLLFAHLSQFDTILALISFTGALFLGYLGWESIKTKGINLEVSEGKTNSLKKGILANFLNPSPYLFWATVGTPYLFKASEISLVTAILFLCAFYALLIGSKIILAILVARTKVFIGQKWYVGIMRMLGIVLFILALLFLADGLEYLK